jgi:hypothetical protein
MAAINKSAITLPCPIFSNIYRNVEGIELSDESYSLIDGYVDELGYAVKRPGLQTILDLGQGTNRPVEGLFWWAQKSCAIVVCNNKIFKLSYTSGTLSATDITSNAPGTAAMPVFCIGVDANVTAPVIYGLITTGSQIIEGHGTTTAISNFTTIADADAPTTVSHIDFIDGYLLATTGKGFFQFCDVNNPTSWQASSFATAMRNPDNIVALKVFNRQVFLFGQVSSEIWENDGASPFAPVPGGFIEIGIIAPYSVIASDDAIFWLDDKRHIVSYSSGNVARISSPYDNEIENFTTVSDCIGQRIDIKGQPFLLFQFPSAQRTLVYNILQKSWSEWNYWDNTYGEYQHFLGKSYCYCPEWGIRLVGSRLDSKILQLSPDFKTDDGRVIRYKKVSGHISYGTTLNKRSRELRIRAKRGEGISAGGEAFLSLRWNDDNRGWSNEVQYSLGKLGCNEIVIRMYPKGIYRTRQYEIVVTDSVGVSFGQAEEDLDLLGR